MLLKVSFECLGRFVLDYNEVVIDYSIHLLHTFVSSNIGFSFDHIVHVFCCLWLVVGRQRRAIHIQAITKC